MPSQASTVRSPLIGRLFIGLATLGIGLYLALSALGTMFINAIYIKESYTVTATVDDVRQSPFASIGTAFSYGYIDWGGSTAYRPIVSFTLADKSRVGLVLPDLSADDYERGSIIDVRVPRDDWKKAREYRARFFWGAPALKLLLGLLCAWCGRLQLRARSRLMRRAKCEKAKSRDSRGSAPPAKRRNTSTRQGRRAPQPAAGATHAVLTDSHEDAPPKPAAAAPSAAATTAEETPDAAPAAATKSRPKRKSSGRKKSRSTSAEPGDGSASSESESESASADASAESGAPAPAAKSRSRRQIGGRRRKD